MNYHVYQNFRIIHYCGKALGHYRINYDYVKNKLYMTKSLGMYYRLIVSAPIICYLMLDALYYVANKPFLTKIEFIYLFEIPCLLLTTIYVSKNFAFHQNCILDILEIFQLLDLLLLKFYTINKKGWLYYIISLFGYAFMSLMLFALVSLILYFAIPDLKIYTLQNILGVFGIFFLVYIQILKLLLFHRCYVLNKIVQMFVSQNRSVITFCRMCREEDTFHKKHLCCQHQLR